MQRVGIHAAGEDFARCRHHGIVSACQPRDAVEQDDHIFFVFHHAFGFFNHHFGHLHMALRRFVKGGGHHFAAHGAGHFGHFFGALVNQQHNQFHIRIIGGDGVGNVLQHHGFARFGRGDQKRALPQADGRNQVDDAAGDVFGR